MIYDISLCLLVFTHCIVVTFLLSVVVEVNDTKSADILILDVRRLTDEFIICLILLRLEAHHCICFQISYPIP